MEPERHQDTDFCDKIHTDRFFSRTGLALAVRTQFTLETGPSASPPLAEFLKRAIQRELWTAAPPCRPSARADAGPLPKPGPEALVEGYSVEF